jgi:hypothetical protein
MEVALVNEVHTDHDLQFCKKGLLGDVGQGRLVEPSRTVVNPWHCDEPKNT